MNCKTNSEYEPSIFFGLKKGKPRVVYTMSCSEIMATISLQKEKI